MMLLGMDHTLSKYKHHWPAQHQLDLHGSLSSWVLPFSSKSNNSTSKTRVAFSGITPGYPFSPYA